MPSSNKKVSPIPKLKTSEYGIDFDALENADAEGGGFTRYTGTMPPKGTELVAYVKKMWWTETAVKADGTGGDPMIKLLVEAAGNADTSVAQYDGLPIWENLALTPAAKWKWDPFFQQFGITLRDVRDKLYVADEDETQGAPITKLGKFVPGSEASWCRVITDSEVFNGKTQIMVDTWLEYGEPEEAEDDAEPEEDEEEATVEPVDETEADEEPEEEEPEAEPAPKGRRRAAQPAAAAPPRTRAAKPAAATTAPARTKRAPAAAAGKPGRRATAAAEYQDEPPF